MAVLVDDVANGASLLVSNLEKLGGLGSELSDLLVLDSLLLEQLGSISLGLLDRSDLLLKEVELSSSALLLVLDWERQFWARHRKKRLRQKEAILALTLLVLGEELNDLVNDLDARPSLLLGLSDNIRVSTLVSLD
jgi:hypothetical protein